LLTTGGEDEGFGRSEDSRPRDVFDLTSLDVEGVDVGGDEGVGFDIDGGFVVISSFETRGDDDEFEDVSAD